MSSEKKEETKVLDHIRQMTQPSEIIRLGSAGFHRLAILVGLGGAAYLGTILGPTRFAKPFPEWSQLPDLAVKSCGYVVDMLWPYFLAFLAGWLSVLLIGWVVEGFHRDALSRFDLRETIAVVRRESLVMPLWTKLLTEPLRVNLCNEAIPFRIDFGNDTGPLEVEIGQREVA